MKEVFYLIVWLFCLFAGATYMSRGIEKLKWSSIEKGRSIFAIIIGACLILLCFLFFIIGMFDIN